MNYIYFGLTLFFLFILFNKKISMNQTWRATITPLASIIGSGFLIAAPILNSLNSQYSYLLMMMLCLASYSIGTIIRWNIATVEGQKNPYLSERVSGLFLSIAYILSVTYYLYLLSSFVLKSTGYSGLILEKTLASSLVCAIALYGHQYGFKSLERIESISVNIKLSIILTFIVGLVIFNINNQIPKAPKQTIDLESLQVLIGLVIMVQGFEVSRYLGNNYSKETRIRSMRYSQIISTGIYFLFILLFSSVFILHPLTGAIEETSVIDSSKYVFHIAPLFILFAALASQLSAALADMSGCSGLIEEFSRGRIKEKNSYIVISVISLIIIWVFNIFEVISLASKGFAIYYFWQCLSSMKYYYKRSIVRVMFSTTVAIFCLCVVIFGIPYE